jgi:hypothetical protein
VAAGHRRVRHKGQDIAHDRCAAYEIWAGEESGPVCDEIRFANFWTVVACNARKLRRRALR